MLWAANLGGSFEGLRRGHNLGAPNCVNSKTFEYFGLFKLALPWNYPSNDSIQWMLSCKVYHIPQFKFTWNVQFAMNCFYNKAWVSEQFSLCPLFLLLEKKSIFSHFDFFLPTLCFWNAGKHKSHFFFFFFHKNISSLPRAYLRETTRPQTHFCLFTALLIYALYLTWWFCRHSLSCRLQYTPHLSRQCIVWIRSCPSWYIGLTSRLYQNSQ